MSSDKDMISHSSVERQQSTREMLQKSWGYNSCSFVSNWSYLDLNENTYMFISNPWISLRTLLYGI